MNRFGQRLDPLGFVLFTMLLLVVVQSGLAETTFDSSYSDDSTLASPEMIGETDTPPNNSLMTSFDPTVTYSADTPLETFVLTSPGTGTRSGSVQVDLFSVEGKILVFCAAWTASKNYEGPPDVFTTFIVERIPGTNDQVSCLLEGLEEEGDYGVMVGVHQEGQPVSFDQPDLWGTGTLTHDSSSTATIFLTESGPEDGFFGKMGIVGPGSQTVRVSIDLSSLTTPMFTVCEAWACETGPVSGGERPVVALHMNPEAGTGSIPCELQGLDENACYVIKANAYSQQPEPSTQAEYWGFFDSDGDRKPDPVGVSSTSAESPPLGGEGPVSLEDPAIQLFSQTNWMEFYEALQGLEGTDGGSSGESFPSFGDGGTGYTSLGGGMGTNLNPEISLLPQDFHHFDPDQCEGKQPVAYFANVHLAQSKLLKSLGMRRFPDWTGGVGFEIKLEGASFLGLTVPGVNYGTFDPEAHVLISQEVSPTESVSTSDKCKAVAVSAIPQDQGEGLPTLGGIILCLDLAELRYENPSKPASYGLEMVVDGVTSYEIPLGGWPQRPELPPYIISCPTANAIAPRECASRGIGSDNLVLCPWRTIGVRLANAGMRSVRFELKTKNRAGVSQGEISSPLPPQSFGNVGITNLRVVPEGER